MALSSEARNAWQIAAGNPTIGLEAVTNFNLVDGLNAVPAAVAAGYKIARGETALDGSNPTPIATGLTTIIGLAVTLKGTAAPGVGTSVITANINGANIDTYAWKVTTSTDNTLIASTGTETVYWVAVGT